MTSITVGTSDCVCKAFTVKTCPAWETLLDTRCTFDQIYSSWITRIIDVINRLLANLIIKVQLIISWASKWLDGSNLGDASKILEDEVGFAAHALGCSDVPAGFAICTADPGSTDLVGNCKQVACAASCSWWYARIALKDESSLAAHTLCGKLSIAGLAVPMTRQSWNRTHQKAAWKQQK